MPFENFYHIMMRSNKTFKSGESQRLSSEWAGGFSVPLPVCAPVYLSPKVGCRIRNHTQDSVNQIGQWWGGELACIRTWLRTGVKPG